MKNTGLSLLVLLSAVVAGTASCEHMCAKTVDAPGYRPGSDGAEAFLDSVDTNAVVVLPTVDAAARRCTVLLVNRHPLTPVRLEITVADAAVEGTARVSVLGNGAPDRTNESGEEAVVPVAREAACSAPGPPARIEPFEVPPASAALIEFGYAPRD